MKNLERYKKDLNNLITNGANLCLAMLFESNPEKFKEVCKRKESGNELIKSLPVFKNEYQTWYTEAISIIQVLIPKRINDFVKLYEIPKARKNINSTNYTIEDYLQRTNLYKDNGWQQTKIVGPEAAISKFEQQLNILKSAQKVFESSLFNIKMFIEADLFDSELEAALYLNKKGFVRGAGAMAGVVLEHHLSEVCTKHNIKMASKKPHSINEYNDKLKENDCIVFDDWRFIQYLVDLRNLCDHSKKVEPTEEKIKELIDGVKKIIKTIY